MEHSSDAIPLLPKNGLLLASHNGPHEIGQIKPKWRAHWAPKLIMLPVICLTTMLSILLTLSVNRSWHMTGIAVQLTLSNQSTIATIVQLTSHTLGIANLYLIITVINFSTRIRLQKTPISLNRLKFFCSIESLRFDPSLPAIHLLFVASFIALAAAPGALWAGAITPVIQPLSKPIEYVSIADYSPSSEIIWSTTNRGNHDVAQGCVSNTTTKGRFSSCPALSPSGFLSSIATATTTEGIFANHTRHDATNFDYIGRSYGAGYSVGLIDDDWRDLALSYQYNETGYNLSVSCIYNNSAAYGFRNVQDGDGLHGIPAIYYSMGRLPNSNWTDPIVDFYAVIGWGNQGKVAWTMSTGSDRYMVGIAADGSDTYTALNNVQCELSWMPCQLEVLVDTQSSTIRVVPHCNGNGDIPDVEPTGGLKELAMVELETISKVAVSLYTSLLGETLLSNVANVIYNHTLSQDNATLVLGAISDSITAAMDDILVAIGSNQIVLAGDTRSVNGMMDVLVLTWGGPKYIYAILILNLLIIALLVTECIRSRAWRDLPHFNHADPKSLIVGSLIGGQSYACDSNERIGASWVGQSDDNDEMGNVKIMLAEIEGYEIGLKVKKSTR